jgi:hypothetical protein
VRIRQPLGQGCLVMARTGHASAGGYFYPVVDRGSARAEVFHKPGDSAPWRRMPPGTARKLAKDRSRRRMSPWDGRDSGLATVPVRAQGLRRLRRQRRDGPLLRRRCRSSSRSMTLASTDRARSSAPPR